MDDHSVSPHRLVEFLTALSRCQTTDLAVRTAAELVAEEFDAEVGAVALDGALVATVGFGDGDAAPLEHLAGLPPGTRTTEVDRIGTCHVLVAAWNAGTVGRLTVGRVDSGFTQEDRNLLLGMAGALGLVLDMIAVLERQRGQQRVLEVLLDIQRSISHRDPLPTILDAVTQGASTVLRGCPVSLLLDDVLDPDRPIVAGRAPRAGARTLSTPVHIHGQPVGALVAAATDGAPLGPAEESLLESFAEHASLALADARTLEAMQEAFRDPLTRTPNRLLYLDRLTQALRAEDRPGLVSVLFVDLDRFKSVNDTMGHAAGDALLRAVSERLRRCVGPGGTVARFGGDEFAVLLESVQHPDDALEVGELIVRRLSEPFGIDGKTVYVGATIGISHGQVGDPLVEAEDLVRDADVAMYRAKAAGGGSVLTYDPGMRAALLQRMELQVELQGALERGELHLHYQPVVDLASGRATGLEALLRWDSRSVGAVPPSDFIPLAELTGAIVPIGRWVLGEACVQLAAWRRQHPDLTMAVNIAVPQLRERTFIEDVALALEASGVPGSALVLEITEGVLLEDEEHIIASLDALKELGVTVALDDFGTGYSSLGYLSRFPVDVLKIDRSFISGTAAQTGGDQLVRTIVELGRAYELDVVAEGIETRDQWRRLLDLGCRQGQGYLFSRPTDVVGIEAFLSGRASVVPTARRAVRETVR